MQTYSPTRNVALIVETSNAYARGVLAGIRRFAAERPRWSFYLAEHSRHETDFSWLRGWNGHGVLARIENEETARFIRELGLPTVDLSAKGLAPELPCVETDDDTIARWAVEHFVERGLRQMAFCGDARFGWSVARAAAFVDHTRRRDAVSHEFTLEPSGVRSRDRERLAGWLRRLPRPVGVLACYDIAGLEVLEACKIAGLMVPDEVAVIGVDNDELFCTLTSPPLSSIQPDTMRTGYVAAEILDAMMAGMVTRQSSDIFSVEDPLVAAALRFVRDRSDSAVTAGAVLRHVGLSRRALDARFVKIVGRTLHGEIVRARIAHVAELLTSTDLTLPQIAERLGFSHSEYMSVMFKKHTGTSPGAYRRAANGAISRQEFRGRGP
jgi:LacI family transcriptional regulator